MNFRTARKSVVILIIFLLLGAALASADIRPANDNLNTAQVATLISQNRNNAEFVILDVRTPAEFQQGHIEEAILIDFRAPSFFDKIKNLDRSKLYLVYCRSGNRSRKAVGIMVQLGFQRVHNMTGGFNDWVSSGFKYTY
ncbi:MAG: rhodanese-like domain-containing protein [Deltaproteobacteria bacterium]|jgi:rhodanese-related sulfurtransferase|nr:rhodanese-like domain-containing protein [Deltaproteobacteria bacterium]MBT4267586.1 rhodanese-like domain-containing protein [Deltaproteobacteria bacterium]MBT4637256.1 rhodanese-like domain-containing protein [Deltaproteobacteria bacterium]MBT6615045.1 rhodanese-like domain-containing protein [Deltaproteobacteria bacterium]